MEGSPAYRNDTGAGLEAYRPCKVERFKCKTPLRGMCLVQARSRRVRRAEGRLPSDTPFSCSLFTRGHVMNAVDESKPGSILVIPWQEAAC